MGGAGRSLPILVFVVLTLLSVAAAYPSYSQQPGLGEVSLSVEPTRVYGLYRVLMPEGYTLDYAAYSKTYDTIVVAGLYTATGEAGRGYVAGIDPSARVMVWRQGLEGGPTALAADSSDPQWVAVGTVTGEVALISIPQGGVKALFYTATRLPVQNLYLTVVEGKPVIAALDSEGFLYIYVYGEESWIEVGPASDSAAAKSLYSPPIARVLGVYEYTGFNSYKSSQTILAVLTNSFTITPDAAVGPESLKEVFGDLLGTVEGILLYRTLGGTVAPATPGVEQGEATTTYKSLYVTATPPSGLDIVLPVFVEPEGSAPNSYGLYTMPSPEFSVKLPASSLELRFYYVVERRDNATGSLVDFECYFDSVTLKLTPGSTTNLEVLVLQPVNIIDGQEGIKECLRVTGFDPILSTDEAQIQIQPALRMSLPSSIGEFDYVSSVDMVYIPMPGGDGPLPSDSIAAVYILEDNNDLGSKGVVVIDYTGTLGQVAGNIMEVLSVDEDLYPQPSPFKPQLDYMAVPLTDVYIDSKGRYIIAGLSDGKVFMYKFSNNRFVKTSAIVIDDTAVTETLVADDGVHLVAMSSDGVMQLIDIASWTPLWRGLPEFPGIATGLQVPQMLNTTFNRAFIVELGGGGGPGRFYILSMEKTDLAPTYITLAVELERLDGTTEEVPLPEGSEAVIMGDDGSILARDYFVGGRALIYAPPGTYTLEVKIPEGLASGSLTASLVVSQPYTLKDLKVELREVLLAAIAPKEPPSPELAIAYTLFAGPKEGVTLTAKPIASDEELGYRPEPAVLTGVTDVNGETLLVLWKGVRYEVEAKADFIEPISIEVEEYATGRIVVPVKPKLVDVDIMALDSEALSFGVRYQLVIDKVSIYLADGSRGVEGITVGSKVFTLKLPLGSYTVTLTASGYLEGTTGFDVTSADETVTVEVPLDPELHDIIVKVSVDDRLGLASGPLSGALVKARLIEPQIPYETQPSVTDEEGRAIIARVRTGVYEIVVSDPFLGEKVIGPLAITASSTITVTLEPSYVDASFRLLDAQLGVEAAGTFTISISYVKTGAFRQFEIDKPTFTLTLPTGIYAIKISSREGFYIDAELTLEITSPGGRVITLEPVVNDVVVRVVYNDVKAGIAVGGVANAVVRLTLVNPQLPIPPVEEVTNERGEVFFRLRPGTYKVEVRSDHTEPLETVIEVVGRHEVTISAIPLYGELRISIVDSERLVKLPQAFLRITWIGAETFSKTLTVEGGEASLELPLGVYEVEASLPNYYNPAQARVELVSESQTLTLLMDPVKVDVLFTVHSDEYVADVGGKPLRLPITPLQGATVVITPVDNVLEALGVEEVVLETGDNGSVVASLRTGSYKVRVEHPFAEPVELNLVVREGLGSVDVITEPRVFKIRLLIVDPEFKEEEQVVPGAKVTLVSYNGVEVNAEFTYGGPMELELPAGRYEMIVEAEGYSFNDIEVTVSDDGNVVVPLEPLKTIVSVTVLAETPQGGESPVTSGLIIFEAVNLPLKDPLIEAVIDNGLAQASLRPGLYRVYYASPDLGLKIQVMEPVEVRIDTGELQVSFKPPTTQLTVEVIDAQLGVRVVDANIIIVYNGPFGNWFIEAPAEGGVAKVEVAPGSLRVFVQAEGYVEASEEATVKEPTTITLGLEPILYSVEIRLIDPDGRPITEPVRVTMVHESLGVSLEAEGEGPVLEIEGVRAGSYLVTVTPLSEATLLQTTSIQATVRDPGVIDPSQITVAYRLFNVEIRLVDARSGESVTIPYVITLERQGSENVEYPKEVEVEAGVARLTLPPGDYTMRLNPVDRDYYVVETPFNFTVDSDETLTFRLEPRLFSVEVSVLDDRRSPLQGALVRVIGGNRVYATGYTDEAGRLTIQVPFGTYIVEILHPGFKPTQTPIVVPQQAVVEVTLEPTVRTLAIRYGPIAVGLVGLAAVIVVLYRVREVIVERLLREEEYF